MIAGFAQKLWIPRNYSSNAKSMIIQELQYGVGPHLVHRHFVDQEYGDFYRWNLGDCNQFLGKPTQADLLCVGVDML